MIRIFIVEDHPVTITGLHSFFRPSRDEVTITGSAGTIDEALNNAIPGTFEVIFMDLWLPDGNPLDNLKRLQNKFHETPVVIYTGENSIHWQRKMFKAGAKAFISKQASKSEIRETLEKVIKGETVYTPYVKEFQSKRKIYSYHDPKYGLTKEQKEVLKYFVEGITSKTIALKTGKYVTSVDRILRDIREIFQADNNLELLKTLLKIDDGDLFDETDGL